MGSDHVELKHLATRREQVERRLKALREELSVLDQKIHTETRELSAIDAQVEQLKKKNKAVVVTEHAILRYLERVKGVDIEAAKREMLPPEVSNQIRALGNGEYPVGTHSVKVKDNVVITILTKEEKPQPKPKPRIEPTSPSSIIEPEKTEGNVRCPRCKERVDRLLKEGFCALCAQEAYAKE